MGCDIHVYTEIKLENEWHPLYMPVPEEIVRNQISRNTPFWMNYYANDNYANYHGRNYYLFTFLAGVRGRGERPYIEPRGIPEDCSSLVRKIYERWGNDAHTPHHYYLTELLEAEWEDWFNTKEDKMYHSGDHPLAEFFQEYLPKLSNLGINPDKVRMTFWFDN